MAKQHSKIEEFRKRQTPISYCNLAINKMGEMKERVPLLDTRVVEGYGVIWGSKNGHDEKFVKGSAAKSINELGPTADSPYKLKFRDRHGKACALFDQISEDDTGLYFRTKPLDKVPFADELLVQLKSGTINNFSIGFRHVWDRVEWDANDDSLINLEMRLFEISAVDIPSDMATYAVRAEEEIEYLTDDVEDFILSLPRSKQLEARHIITRCMSLREQEPLDVKARALRNMAPAEVGLDFDYIIKNIKLP